MSTLKLKEVTILLCLLAAVGIVVSVFASPVVRKAKVIISAGPAQIANLRVDNIYFSPAASPGVKDSVTVSYSYSGPPDNIKIEIIPNEGNIPAYWTAFSAAQAGEYSSVWDGKNLSQNYVAEGAYRIRVSVSDPQFLGKDAQEILVFVDNTAPVFRSIQVNQKEVTDLRLNYQVSIEGDHVFLSGAVESFSSVQIGWQKVGYRMDGFPAPAVSAESAPFVYLLDTGANALGKFLSEFNLPPGNTGVRLRAEDRAGNSATAPELEISVLQPDLGKVIVYPNPYKSTLGLPGMEFINLTAQSKIKIFNIAGELVKTASEEEVGNSGSYLWNLRNDAGDEVASGIYVYYIENQKGQTKKGKLGIIR